MPKAEGFTWKKRKDGNVVIFHHGRIATVLRDAKATAFITAANDGDNQELMAGLTSDNTRVDERQNLSHPRNRN